MAKDQGVSVSPDTLREKYAEIQTIDEWLESVSGSSSAGKTAIKNSLIKDEANAPTIKQMVESVVNFLNENSADDSVRAAVYFGVTKGLDEALGKQADEFVTAAAEASKSQVEQVQASDDEIAAKRAERKQKVTEFQALKGILEMFGKQAEIADIPEPKVLRGAIPGQKRAPRKINLMSFNVDGNDLPEDKNTLAGVADACGIKVKELRAALTEQGVDLKNPKDFTATVNGKTVVGSGAPVDETPEVSEETNEAAA